MQRFRRRDKDAYGARSTSLSNASSHKEWVRLAAALDEADGGLEWCALGGGGDKLVDSRALRAATQRLRRLLKMPEADGKVHAMMYALRGGALLARDAHGMAEPRLFERARTCGPKIVENYVRAALDAIELVEFGDDHSAPIDARLAFFNECRHAHGRTALLLSGGAGLGAYHLGVVAALREAGMLPRVISGASAGSIVAATVCTRTDSELAAILHVMNESDDDDDDFQDYHGGHQPSAADAVQGDPIFRLDFFRWRSSSAIAAAAAALDQADDSHAHRRRRRSSPRSSLRQQAAAIPESVEDDDDDDDVENRDPKGVRHNHNDVERHKLDETRRVTMDSATGSLKDWTALMCGDHLAEVIRSNVGECQRLCSRRCICKSRSSVRRGALWVEIVDAFIHVLELASVAGGDYTFQEAFDRTGKILNIPVLEFDATGQSGRVKAAAAPRLLNYLTAPHVVVWSASRASCAVPGVFAPSPLLVRDSDGELRYEDDVQNVTLRSGSQSSGDAVPFKATRTAARLRAVDVTRRTVYVDGSMGADLPMERVQTLFNCTHFICSQTNVHAVVLGDSALRLVGATAPGVRQPPGVYGRDKIFSAPSSVVAQCYDTAHAVLRFIKSQLKTWVREGTTLADELVSSRQAKAAASTHRARSPWGDRGWWERWVPWQFAGWALAVTTQPYEGRPQDVTIVPWAGHLSVFGSLNKTLDNPRRGAPIADVIDAGRKNTWNELAKIEAHTAVEFALERAVHRLRLALFRDTEQRHTAVAASGQTRDALGRTPSFYTSPSLLQLSGLAVFDPVVKVDSGRRTSSTLRDDRPQTKLDQLTPAEAPVGPGPSVDPPTATSLVQKVAKGDHRERQRAVSADNVTTRLCPCPDPSFVLKTSTMANFYYRPRLPPAPFRSMSYDRLARIESKPLNAKSLKAPLTSSALGPQPLSSSHTSYSDKQTIRHNSSSFSDADMPFF